MQTDDAREMRRTPPSDETRREILAILAESGVLPAQGIEGMIDRFLCRGAGR